ncbi:hypothetical protein Pelo_18240 [Pelomyxa schiedti]|nr:hypothetical protein Pelo_18240 [Pelomyxa schiedti]
MYYYLDALNSNSYLALFMHAYTGIAYTTSFLHFWHLVALLYVEFPAEIFCLTAPCWPLRLDADAGADSGAALTSGGKSRMGDEES